MGSLLGSIMPAEGLRLEATITLGISEKRRFYIDGGAGLKATLPVETSAFGVVTLHTLTIEVVATKEKPDEPGSLDARLYGAFTVQVGTYFRLSADRAGFSYRTQLPKDKSGAVLGTDMKWHGLLPTGI